MLTTKEMHNLLETDEKAISEFLGETTTFGHQVKRCIVKFGVDKQAGKSYDAQWGAGSAARGTKEYTYKCFVEMGLQEGDLAVVNTPSYGITVVTVVRLEDWGNLPTASYKWIIGKVDTSIFETIKANAEMRKRIIRDLTARAKAKKSQALLDSLFKDDSEAQALIKELRDLSSLNL